MLAESAIWFSVLCALLCGKVATLQIPLHDHVDQQSAFVDASEKRPRQLNGRFLQITDFHPDRFYEVYSSTSSGDACHRGDGPAGVYGAETSECDSPVSLINATFDWIKAELKDSIDFVIWTGDSARHDNDEKFPRNVDQVVGLNKLMVDKVLEVFGKPDNDDDDDPTNDLIIPVVPTFGNNDILPHNIFEKGPNKWTRQYLSLWRKFIPEEQRHQFEQGGWFYVEVIPNNLAVFSLNSLYFFDSNSAVDGCAAKSEPGYRQMEWMRIQLQFIRDRGMKAIIIGHVPPARTENKHSWDESCWQKYALWMQLYRDVIVGSMYGHMNLDHFMLQDFEDISKDVKRGYETTLRTRKNSIHINDETLLEPMASGNYLLDLRADWSTLPQPPSKKSSSDAMIETSDDARPYWEIEPLLIDHSHNLGGKKKHKGDKKPKDYWEEIGGKFAERFSVSFASPSVVPNYFPSLRLYTFNATGLDIKTLHVQRLANAARLPELIMEEVEDSEDWETDNENDVDVSGKKKKKKKNHNKKQRFTIPKGPSDTAPPGPAYSPQSLSLLGLTQYYANLTQINNDYDALGVFEVNDDLEQQKWKEGKHKKHNGVPHDKDHTPHPKKFKYEVLYDTHDDKVYNMTDLTMPSFLDLARRIGHSSKSKGLDLELAVGENAQGEVDEDEAHVTELADEDETYEELEKKKKKGKKGKKKKHHNKRNKAWVAFVRRAFVGTISDEEVEEAYGS